MNKKTKEHYILAYLLLKLEYCDTDYERDNIIDIIDYFINLQVAIHFK